MVNLSFYGVDDADYHLLSLGYGVGIHPGLFRNGDLFGNDPTRFDTKIIDNTSLMQVPAIQTLFEIKAIDAKVIGQCLLLFDAFCNGKYRTLTFGSLLCLDLNGPKLSAETLLEKRARSMCGGKCVEKVFLKKCYPE